MLIIVTQLDKASTAKLQGIYKLLPFRYLVDLLSLLENFVSWYLLVNLGRSKPIVNRVSIIIIINGIGIIHNRWCCNECIKRLATLLIFYLMKKKAIDIVRRGLIFLVKCCG